MQLTSSNRRDIVEDLLDIKIFYHEFYPERQDVELMNLLEFSIKKDMIEDKIEMQENFIKDVEKSGRERVQKKNQILNLLMVVFNTKEKGLMTRVDTELKRIRES